MSVATQRCFAHGGGTSATRKLSASVFRLGLFHDWELSTAVAMINLLVKLSAGPSFRKAQHALIIALIITAAALPGPGVHSSPQRPPCLGRYIDRRLSSAGRADVDVRAGHVTGYGGGNQKVGWVLS